MESENVVIKTKDFLDKYGLLEGTSFTFEKDENIVRIKCGKALWDLVRYSSYKAEFSDLSRAMKDIIMQRHPEIREEFDEEYEDMDEYPERFDFPNRIEFDSEEEYLELKEKYLYDEFEKYIEQYDLVIDIGDILYNQYEKIATKCGYDILWGLEEEFKKYTFQQKLIIFEK